MKKERKECFERVRQISTTPELSRARLFQLEIVQGWKWSALHHDTLDNQAVKRSPIPSTTDGKPFRRGLEAKPAILLGVASGTASQRSG